jgi:hypothetical protein
MIRWLAALCVVLAPPLAAQERDETFRLGNDVYLAGASAVLDATGIDDLFAAAERVEVAAPLAGSALLAGRRVTANAAVAGDIYAAGADVTVAAPVGGDATLAGYDVTVDAPVGADLRAAARHIQVGAQVAGTALLAGDTVTVDAEIAGDAVVAAETLDFGPEARLGGRLILYEDAGAPLAVPDRVIPSDRIERHTVDGREAFGPIDRPARSWLALGTGFLIGTAILALIAAIVASLAPEGLERLRAITGAGPFRTFGIGFLTLAALIGASVLAVLTLIGILVAPLLAAAAMVLALLGYVIGVYLVGLAAWDRIGQLPPDSFGERLLAALIGAALVGLVALVPFFGWIVLLVLAVTGLGALSAAVLRPTFRT